MKIDPERDILLSRLLPAPPALVWRCWTEPALFAEWYLPKPWQARDLVLEAWPGGRFAMTVAGPEAQEFPVTGSFLVAEPARRLVFTDLMDADFAPFDLPDTSLGPSFTAVVTLAPEGAGTRQVSVARHRSASDCAENRASGFEAGWQVTADQLAALVARL